MRKHNLQRRRTGSRRENKFIFIVGEGECTEPNYFDKINLELRYSGVSLKTPRFPETDAIGLVNRAINLKKNRECNISLKEGDEIYCVYDVDENRDVDLEAANRLAEANGIKILLSNPCFEIWILLHFEPTAKAYQRDELYFQVKKYIKNYEKCKEIYSLIKPRQKTAIENAKRLNYAHDENGISLSCRRCNPSTQVFRIIEHINKDILKKKET